MSNKPSKLILYLYMLALMLSGAVLSAWRTLLNSSQFSHPFFIPFVMVLGDALCIFLYFYEVYRARKKYGSYQLQLEVVNERTRGRNTHMNPIFLALPKLLNLGAVCLLGLSFSYTVKDDLEFLHESHELLKRPLLEQSRNLNNVFEHTVTSTNNDSYISYELSLALQGNMTLVIVLGSLLLLKRRQYRHHWLATGIIFVATWMICIPLLVHEHKSALDVFIGISMVLGAIILYSLQYMLEERLMTKYFLSPFRVVGWQGVWGVLYLIIFLPLLQYLECSKHFCSNGSIEDSIFALKQIGNDYWILIFITLSLIISSLYHLLGITIIKYTSANNRTVLQLGRIVFVWIFFICFSGNGHQTLNYIQLVGYLILFMGIAIYNEIIVFPWFKFNENTMDEIEKRDQQPERSMSLESSISFRSTQSQYYQVNI